MRRSNTFRIIGQSTTPQGSRPHHRAVDPAETFVSHHEAEIVSRAKDKKEGWEINWITVVVSFPYDVYISSMLTVCWSATGKEPRRKTKRSHSGEARRAERAHAAAILSDLGLCSNPNLPIFLCAQNNYATFKNISFPKGKYQTHSYTLFSLLFATNSLPGASFKIILNYFQYF